MSPLAQFFSVATVTAAIIAAPWVSLALLGITLVLTIMPFVIVSVRR
jgi:hypothetical protein